MRPFSYCIKIGFERIYNRRINTTDRGSTVKSIFKALWGTPKDDNFYNWLEQIFVIRLLKNILKLVTELPWEVIDIILLNYYADLEGDNAPGYKKFLVGFAIILNSLILCIGERITSPIRAFWESYEAAYGGLTTILREMGHLIGPRNLSDFEVLLSYSFAIFVAFLSFATSLFFLSAIMIFSAPKILVLAASTLSKEANIRLLQTLISISHFPLFKQVGVFFSHLTINLSSYISTLPLETQFFSPLVASATSFFVTIGAVGQTLLKYIFSLCPIGTQIMQLNPIIPPIILPRMNEENRNPLNPEHDPQPHPQLSLAERGSEQSPEHSTSFSRLHYSPSSSAFFDRNESETKESNRKRNDATVVRSRL